MLKNCVIRKTSSKKDWADNFSAGVKIGSWVSSVKNLRKNDWENDKTSEKMTSKRAKSGILKGKEIDCCKNTPLKWLWSKPQNLRRKVNKDNICVWDRIMTSRLSTRINIGDFWAIWQEFRCQLSVMWVKLTVFWSKFKLFWPLSGCFSYLGPDLPPL